LLVSILEPRFVTMMPPWLTLATSLGAIVVGGVASTIPVRAVARIDPALVFRV